MSKPRVICQPGPIAPLIDVTECTTCKGEGQVDSGLPLRKKPCPDCGGRGWKSPTPPKKIGGAPQAVTFQIGEKVRVANGPFATFEGHVQEVDEQRARLKVGVLIYGRPTPVELEFGQVEKVA